MCAAFHSGSGVHPNEPEGVGADQKPKRSRSASWSELEGAGAERMYTRNIERLENIRSDGHME